MLPGFFRIDAPRSPAAFVQPLDVPSSPGVFSGMTTGPDAPAAPLWICAATAVGRSLAASLKHAWPCPARRRIVAVPFPTGSPFGVSESPTNVTLKAVPPVAARRVFGQPPFGTGKMSAGCALILAVVSLSFLYGAVADEVR